VKGNITDNKAKIVKIITVIPIFIFLFSAALSLYAAEGFKLIASEEKGVSGEEVVVTISAENAALTEGGQFVLGFDPELLRPVSVEPGKLLTEASSALDMANLEYNEGQLMFIWITAMADTEDSGEVCLITFDLLTKGETLLEFYDIVIAPETIEDVTAIPGKVIVNSEAGIQEDNDQGALLAIITGTNGYLWLIVLIVLVIVAAAAGFVILRKRKKPAARH